MMSSIVLLSIFLAAAAGKVSLSWNFENFQLGLVNGQQGWTGYNRGTPDDPSIVLEPTTTNHVLRVTNNVPSGGIQAALAPALAGCAGESTSALARGGPACTSSRSKYFALSFAFRTGSASFQDGLRVAVAAERGDGARMSAIILQDAPTGTEVHFSYVKGTTNPADFEETNLITVPRTTASGAPAWHRVVLVLKFVDGENNDVADVYVDGKHWRLQGSWENYYRHDAEGLSDGLPAASRTVSTVSWRIKDVPAGPVDAFLFDNVAYAIASDASDVNACQFANGGCDAKTHCSFSSSSGSLTCGDCPHNYEGSGKTGCNTLGASCRRDSDCYPTPLLRCLPWNPFGTNAAPAAGSGAGEGGGEGEGEGSSHSGLQCQVVPPSCD